jgi:hypothetical protein
MNCFYRVCWVRTRQGGAAPGGGQALMGSRGQQARAGSGGLAGGAQVAVDLTGDVTLRAADGLFLRQAFRGAPLDVGAGVSAAAEAFPGASQHLKLVES